MRQAVALLLATLILAANGAPLDEALAGSQRTPANVARDVYRHPKQVLEFFGVKPDSVVVEVWPGTGWWTEILGPYMHDRGVYYAAGFATTLKGVPEYQIAACPQGSKQPHYPCR